MVAAFAAPQTAAGDVHLVTEIRGAPARLFDEASGEIVISGPAGTAKTRGILEWIHRRCSTERLRVLVLRKTLESLKASALVTYTEEVLHGFDGRQSVYDGVTYFSGNKLRPAEFTYQQTGSKIVAAGMDQTTKIKSTRWDIVFPNECTELSLDEWEMVTGRTDRPSMFDQPPSVVVGDCNPDAPTHWILQRAQHVKADGTPVLKLWPTTHQDNPAMWDRHARQWTPAGTKYIDRLDALTGVRYQRLRLGKWVAAEGQIYENWNPELHLINRFDVPAEWPRYWDIDFGFTNPFVWHDWAMDPDGRLFLTDEIYRTQVLVEDHAANILNRTRGRRRPSAIVTDHDAEDRATFERKTGFRTTPAIKEVSPGIQAVSSRLRPAQDGRPRLYVFRDACPYAERDRSLIERGKPSCTADEFPTYVWDTRQGLRKGEQPWKEDDHGMDGTRYQVMFHEPKRSNAVRGIR